VHCLPTSVFGATPMSYTERNQVDLDSKNLLFRNPKIVSFLSVFLAAHVHCQQVRTDEDETSGPSTEESSLLSGPGDIIDDDDAASKKSAHSHRIDVTGLALLYIPEFWQLWLLMGLLTGVGLMTIK
jgi:hypothetical protein